MALKIMKCLLKKTNIHIFHYTILDDKQEFLWLFSNLIFVQVFKLHVKIIYEAYIFFYNLNVKI